MKRSNIYRDLTISSTSFAIGCMLAVTVFSHNPWMLIPFAGLIICLVIILLDNDEDEDEDDESVTDTQ